MWMRVLALHVDGFRGIRKADIVFDKHAVLVGPNGSGKSTILDALSLTFGRTQLVRELTEHDFFGSTPGPATRFRLVATLGGFSTEVPDDNQDWFREGRGVPKWWNDKTKKADPQPSADASTLCVQIGLVARFDHEELGVEQFRYFHDDDQVVDPFDDEIVTPFPSRLLNEIGFFVLPVRRTWEGTVSFASELFRRAVATLGGIPAQTLLEERDRLRAPAKPLEDEPLLKPLVDRMNEQFRQLLPHSPEFKLRLTATDSEALLRGLVPHYAPPGGVVLPAGRQGTGILSLQTFVLLLEIGRERRKQGLPFILALEEPELHVPPGLQRKLVAQAVAISEQTICTSHAPRVAAFYPATSTLVIDRGAGDLSATPILASSLTPSATSVQRKLYLDDRSRIVDALMHHRVLVPEGRGDHEWLRLLSDVVETGEHAFGAIPEDSTPFGAVVGVVPTHSSAVQATYEELRRLHRGVVPLVDGDEAGKEKLAALLKSTPPPATILAWRDGWEIEDAVMWILRADEAAVIQPLNERLGWQVTSVDDLLAKFKTKEGPGRAKTDYLAYEEVASVIRDCKPCRDRARMLLDAMTRAILRKPGVCGALVVDKDKSTPTSAVIRLEP
jgi:energy-coupling factor transporter ATP-binding protein EcfA2